MNIYRFLAVVFMLNSSHGLAVDYHSNGKSFGQSALDSQSKNSTKEPSAPAGWDASKNGSWDSIKLSNSNPPQTSSYKSGDPFTLGSQRIANCSTSPTTGDRIADKDCEAVNFLAKNPTTRKKFQVEASDPLFALSNKYVKDGAVMLTPSSACETRTVPDPSDVSIEVCHEYVVAEPKTCVMGREISIDWDSNFQCVKTINQLSQVTCNKIASVSTSMSSGCSPGTWGPSIGVSPCLSRDCDRYTAKAYCNPSGAGTVYIFAAGVGQENWGRNCSTASSGGPVYLSADGYGSGSYGGSTNWHICNNGCCGGWGGSVTGKGCVNGTCTVEVNIGGYGVTFNYNQAPHKLVSTTWVDQCSPYR